jgi:cell division protein FtsB
VAKAGIPRKQKKTTTAARPPQWRYGRLLLLFVASLFVLDGLIGDRGLVAMVRARREYDAAVAALSQQRAENARLREEARRLREDPDAIEEIARRDLGFIKAGERVFIIHDLPPAKR